VEPQGGRLKEGSNYEEIKLRRLGRALGDLSVSNKGLDGIMSSGESRVHQWLIQLFYNKGTGRPYGNKVFTAAALIKSGPRILVQSLNPRVKAPGSTFSGTTMASPGMSLRVSKLRLVSVCCC